MKQVFILFALFFLFSCQNVDNNEKNQETSKSQSYEVPGNFNSIVPNEYRKKYGQKAKAAFFQSNLRESKSTFALGAKVGEIIGFFDEDILLFLRAESGSAQNQLKEYYFYTTEKKCYYAAVLKKDSGGKDVLHTYWMIPETDSIYYEMFYPKTIDPINVLPLDKPENAYVMNVVDLDSHISPNTLLAFTSVPDRAAVSRQPSGQMVKKISMGNNETGMDVHVLKSGEVVRYQIDLNKRYNYMVAVNPLQAGFMMRGIDQGKVFIEDVSTFNWFTDQDDQILEFEIYNPELVSGETKEFRVGVFGEPRF